MWRAASSALAAWLLFVVVQPLAFGQGNGPSLRRVEGEALPEQTEAEAKAQAEFVRLAQAKAYGEAEKVLRGLRDAQEAPGPLNIRVDSNTFYGSLQTDQAVSILILLLDSVDARTREPAVRILGYRQAHVAGGRVLELLDDPSPRVRQAAASTLGRLGVRKAVPKIKALLESDDVNIAYGAADALASFGDVSLAPALIARYRRAGPELKRRLIYPIGRFKTDEVKEMLLGIVEDGSPEEVSNAIWPLSQFEDERIVPLLLKRLETADAERGEAYPLVSALGRSKDARAYAALVELLESGEENVRGQAAYALGQLGDPKAVPVLIATLEKTKDSSRRQILQALGMLGTDEAMEVLLEELKTADANTRSSIFYSIARSENPRVIPVLMEALDDENDNLRQSACRALGRLRVNEAVPKVAELLKDKAQYVRYAAAAALGQIGDRRALKPLIEASKVETEKLPKDWMILAIAQINRYKEPVSLEEMLERIGQAHRVLWTRTDEEDADLEWIGLENEFVVFFDTKLYTVRDFRDALDTAGVGEVTVNVLHFAPDRVWIGTTKGLFAYTRLTRTLEQYAVAMRYVDADVTAVSGDRGAVVVTVEAGGETERYRYDPKADAWSAVE